MGYDEVVELGWARRDLTASLALMAQTVHKTQLREIALPETPLGYIGLRLNPLFNPVERCVAMGFAHAQPAKGGQFRTVATPVESRLLVTALALSRYVRMCLSLQES